MIAIVCVDDSLGMIFNNRRQSRDIVLTQKIVELVSSSRLLINEFSRTLFASFNSDNIIVDDNFLEAAGCGDFCFVENQHLTPYVDKIEQLIVFKWNRSYPSDFSLDLELSKYILTDSLEFEGNSHDKITMEVYKI